MKPFWNQRVRQWQRSRTDQSERVPNFTAPRLSRGNLEAQLTGIAEGGGPKAAAAQAALDEIAENRGQIAALQAERANRQAFTSATRQAAKAVQTGTKAKQAAKTVAKVTQAAKTGAKRLTTIAAKGGAFVKAGALLR